jgi:hypothetical protein
LGLHLTAVFSSDVGHFDVLDMASVLDEAQESVEAGLLDANDFKEFTFANAVDLYTGMNPDFFSWTVVENFLDDWRRANT